MTPSARQKLSDDRGRWKPAATRALRSIPEADLKPHATGVASYGADNVRHLENRVFSMRGGGRRGRYRDHHGTNA
jgi:hypothetical protein